MQILQQETANFWENYEKEPPSAFAHISTEHLNRLSIAKIDCASFNLKSTKEKCRPLDRESLRNDVISSLQRFLRMFYF